MLVWTFSNDFSEEESEIQLIYIGSVLLDQPSQGFNQSTKNPSETKTTFTGKLQDELTQAQSPTNPKSYQTLVQR